MSTALAADGYGLAEVTDIAPDTLAQFSCGKAHLDHFLTDRAGFMHQEHLATVWVVLHRDLSYPAGYFTLHNDSLELMGSEETSLGLRDNAELKRFPAIVIGRLAVDFRLQGTGVSDVVMQLTLSLIQNSVTTRVSAARLIVVDADNEPKVLHFYQRNGFEISLWADKQARHQGGKHSSRATVKMLRDILST